jgi:hypothetical protein
MISGMSSTEIREILTREPFQPFRVRLTSGDRYEIRNPELAVPMKTRLFIAAPDADEWTLIPYMHIAVAETISSEQRTPRRKRRP